MKRADINVGGASCPVPLSHYERILLAHGSGGRLTHSLIEKLFLPQFRNEYLERLHDGAMLDLHGTRLAFTTDSYVVSPLFFPGGDIGELAVNGTINDLAMCGAKPMFLSAGFIVEEGFPVEDLQRIAASMQGAAARADVHIVTGDTKVVERGKADKLFINTAGIGLLADGVTIDPTAIQAGDRILLSGSIAEHGVAILSVREGLQFETQVESDTAPLHELVAQMLRASRKIRVLRDPTRGGVATTLNELAASARVGLRIYESSILVKDEVLGACEVLGLDPLYIANEGKLLAIVAAEDAENVLRVMREHPLGRDAAIIGEAVSDHPSTVVMKTSIGGTRVVDMLSGEQLPRIC